MKALLVAESRQGKLLPSSYETLTFAQSLGADCAIFLVGSPNSLPAFAGTVYLADVAEAGEYRPKVHKQLLLQTIAKEQPDLIVFSHSSYGWDLAPRVAASLKAPQISEVIGLADGGYLVPVCNAKLRRTVQATGPVTIVTLQAGAFSPTDLPTGTPQVETLAVPGGGSVEFLGFEAAEAGGVDLSKAEVIVSAGRGIGKPENLAIIESLAKALHGEYGASRPVVDSGWAPHNRQVGSTGQTVAPKLYVACGISGAIQHLAGMKKSEFIVAINTDKDAPIGEVADVLVVGDLKAVIPALVEKLANR